MVFNPSDQWKAKADGFLWVQGQPSQLQSKSQKGKGYTEKPCLKKQTNKKTWLLKEKNVLSCDNWAHKRKACALGRIKSKPHRQHIQG